MRNIITKIINRSLKLILNPKLSWIFISYEFKKKFYDIFFIFKKK